MKKLIIAAAIVCAAAMSQASTAKWSISNVYKYGSDTSVTANKAAKGAYYVMCFLASDTAGNTTISVADATKLAQEGKLTDLAAKALDKGTLTANGMYVSPTRFDGGWGDGDSVSLYTIVFDAAAPADAKHFQVSALKTQDYTGTDQDKTISIGSMKDVTWGNIQAAPEPTSGLLLLLGVAGLALRRRRA